MTPIELREKNLATHLRFTCMMSIQTWVDSRVLKLEDADAQFLAVLLEACKQEAEAQGLPFERIIAEVTRNESK